MKQIRLLVGILTLTVFATTLMAQTGKESGSKFGHGEDSVNCRMNTSLYRGYTKNKDYAIAQEYWVPVFDECPKASKNIYLDGVKIYKYLLKENKGTDRVSSLVDTLMLIYDRRIENYGQKGNVRGRQGSDLIRFSGNDLASAQKGYAYLKESVEIQKTKSSKAVLPTLLSTSITLYNAEVLDANQVIEDYLLVSGIVDEQIIKKPTDSKLKDVKAALDDNFIKDGPGSCETLIGFFTEEYKTKSDDSAFLEMLTSLLRKRDCTDSELFFSAAKKLHSLAPSASSAVNIAILAKDKGNYKESVDYFNQAIEMETDDSKKADDYFAIAVNYNKLKEYSNARSAALKSAKLKPGYGEPYILIGQLYAASKDICTNDEPNNLPGAVFWAAVDQFNKAKSIDPSLAERANKLIATYSNYFPNKEEAFFKGINEGSTHQIKGCWINESTKARFK